MAEETKLKTRTYIPKVYYNGNLLSYKDTPLTIKEVELCKYCKEEITFEQIKHVVPEAEKRITDKILIYLNKYRQDYKLDSCLRKAHFIAQVGAEMKFLEANLKESHHYDYSTLNTKQFSLSQKIDNVILSSLKDHLTSIFKITDKEGKVIVKTNDQLEIILNDNKVIVDVRKLYGKYKTEEEVLKIVKKKEKDKNGKEIEVIEYNIVLNKHDSFRIPLFSRMYGPYPEEMKDTRGLGNGNELSREGFIFCGKGIKQLTGKANYVSFSQFRKNNPFPNDPKGYINFTEITDKVNYQGDFDLLADTNDVIYGVQAALWYFQKGGSPRKGKYASDWTNEDDIQYTSLMINGGYNGLETRKNNTLKAKEDEAFKVYKHYKEIHRNGTKEQKEEVENILIKISQDNFKKDSSTQKQVNLKDPEAESLLKELRKQEAIKLTPKGINVIPFEISNDLKLKPIFLKKE